MSRTYDLFLVDAFTKTPFTGNPAGVVPDASGMSDTEMQAIAREVNATETAFVLPPDGPDHDLRVRFFTRRLEVPLAGHAAVAVHHVLCETGGENPGRSGILRLQKTSAGVFPVEVTVVDGWVRVMMSQPPPDFSALRPDMPRVVMLQALGLHDADLDNRLPMVAAYAADYSVLVPVAGPSIVDALAPDLPTLSRVFASYMVFSLDTEGPGLSTYCRMFAPALGIAEDPVTGMAHGALGAHLVTSGLAPAGDEPFHFFSRQGVVMGRPGEVEIIIGREGTSVLSVQVGGSAVTIFRAKFTLD